MIYTMNNIFPIVEPNLRGSDEDRSYHDMFGPLDCQLWITLAQI